MKIREKLTTKEFGLDYDRPRDFVTLQRGRPGIYLIWSCAWTIYHLIWIGIDGYLFTFKVEPQDRGKWLTYLTNWSYLILTIHAFLDFLLACTAYFVNEDIILGKVNHMPPLYKLSWVMFNISNTSGVLLMVTYWVKLAISTSATSVNKHGINAVYIVLCVLVTAKPIKFQHCYQPMIFSFTYMLFTGLYAVAVEKPIYSFLDWREKPGKACGLVFAYIFLCVPLIHGCIFGMYCLRCYAAAKYKRRESRLSNENIDKIDKNGILRNENVQNQPV